MPKAAGIPVNKNYPSVATREDELDYIDRMLRELRTKATGVDTMLVYLLEMASAHATDLLSGVARMKRGPQ